MKSERKRYLIYGHGGSYNHGVEALTKCTIALLRGIEPDCYIILSSHFPEQDKEFDLDVDEYVTRNVNGKTNYEVYKDTIDKITEDTIAIHIGGDNFCYPNWQRYATVHKEVINKGAVSILWGCSIDEDKIDDEMLNVLSEHTLILARECMTYETLVKLGLKNVRRVSDIAFSLQIIHEDIPIKNYVAINFSPLVCRINSKVKGVFQKLVDYILVKTNFNIALIPHVVVKVDNDYDVLSEIDTYGSDRIYLVSDKLSASQYKGIISNARVCVAARTHATIAAYSTSVPTIAVGYSTKAVGIARDLGVSEYLVDVMDDELEEKLIKKFQRLIRDERVIRKYLETEMEKYKKNIINTELVKVLKGEIV